MSTHCERCLTAAEALEAVADEPAAPIFSGFDGFIDSIMHAVDRRIDVDSYKRFETIAAYGQRIVDAAGKSTNIERVLVQTKLGGNGPIMALPLCRFGHPVTYAGNLGEDGPHPVFADLVEQAEEVISLGPVCMTDAFEFSDGKVMMTLTAPIQIVTWQRLLEVIGLEGLRQRLQAARGIASVDWTQIIGLTEIWRQLGRLLSDLDGERRLLFIDLADPSRRDPADVVEGMAVLSDLQAHADVILGVNEEEGRQVMQACGLEWPADLPDLERAQVCAETLQKHLGLHCVVVHFVAESACAQNQGSWACPGFFTPDPKITTGAGDHFNAGFFSALLRGIDPRSALMVGMACSGFYVRQAQSPSSQDLACFLREQGNEKVEK